MLPLDGVVDFNLQDKQLSIDPTLKQFFFLNISDSFDSTTKYYFLCTAFYDEKFKVWEKDPKEKTIGHLKKIIRQNNHMPLYMFK